MIEICQSNNWEYELFSETGSSQDINRPQFQKMLKKVERLHFDGVLVKETSRIGRNNVIMEIFENTMRDSDTLLILPHKTIDYNSIGNESIMIEFETLISKAEYQNTKRRLVQGSIFSAKKGHYLCKRAPFGYDYDSTTKKLVPNKYFDTVCYIFQMYLKGLSTNEIAESLIREGKTGLLWSSAGISRLLNNDTYKGHSYYGRTYATKSKVTGARIVNKVDETDWICVPNTHKAVVTENEWNQVKKLQKERSSRPYTKLGKHAFSSLIHCALCGKVHSFQRQKNGTLRVNSCQTKHFDDDMIHYKRCKNGSTHLSNIENLFYSELSKRIDELKNYKDKIKEPKESNRNTILLDKKNKLKKLKEQMKKVQQGFMSGIFDEKESAEQIADIRSHIRTLDIEIAELESQSNVSEKDYVQIVIERMENFMKGKSNLTEREQNNILIQLVDKIEYKNIDSKIELKIHWK